MEKNVTIAILMREHAYPGREFAQALSKNNIDFDVITHGSYTKTSEIEEERCNGNWNPPLIQENCATEKRHHFESISDSELIGHLTESEYDIGIQGGNGIIKPEVFEKFEKGLLNFHPGYLPEYRGSSAPEHQIYDGKEIYCTCHLLDDGLDTGDIIRRSRLTVDLDSYYSMRASIYPEMAKVLVEVTSDILAGQELITQAVSQRADETTPNTYIGDEKIEYLVENWDQFVDQGEIIGEK